MRRLILTTIGLSLLLSSCLKDLTSDRSKTNADKLSLTISMEGFNTDGKTRAMVAPEEGEDKILNLYLLFFTADAYRNGEFLDYVEVDIPDEGWGINIHADIDLTGTSLSASTAYNILAIGNIGTDLYLPDGDSADEWMINWEGKTENQVMFEARAVVEAKQPVSPDALLMYGRYEKPSTQNQVHMLLKRNAVRFDVNNNLNTTHDLVSSSVWNSYPSSSIWGEGVSDYSSTAHRIREHYGISNLDNEIGAGVDGNGEMLGNIKGGLYVFENQVAAPETYDNVTTCIIVGLRDRSTGEITYYRANIHPEGNAQILRRNFAYSLTITGISGPGAATEELAYIGQGNKLKYDIGVWQLDPNGLIVADDYSILSLPTKTINIGREESTSTFSIYTFTSLPDAAPLTVRSQTYNPAGDDIKAYLDGNTLVIEAKALRLDETERRGIVVLSFAGLENSISIYQSGLADDHLRVYLPDGGIPRFLSYAGINSGLIRVEASGPWTAQLYMPGFSFNPSPEPAPRITLLRSTDGLVTDNKFRVYTWSRNEEEATRNAFIVVTLDKDPENYSAVVRLSQAAAGAVKLTPEDQETIQFNGIGGLVTVPLPATNVDEFIVRPGTTDDMPPQTKYWYAEIINVAPGALDKDKFEFAYTPVHDPLVPENNKVKVKTVGINTSGRIYTAVLRIATDPGTYTDITITQLPANFDFVPTTVPVVPTVGGNSNAVGIDTDPSLTWTATITTNGGTSGARTLVHHEAILVDEAGNPLGAGPHSVSTKFRVQFPKVYYPNRDLSVSAAVTVTVGGGMSKTFNVTQNTLTAKAMYGYGITGTPAYGGMGNTYNQGWDGNSGSWGLAQIPGYSRNSTIGGSSVTSVAEGVTYFHITPHFSGATGTSYTWAATIDFLDNRDAITFIQTQDNNGVGPMNNGNSPTKRAGYPNVVYTGSANPTVHVASAGKKVYEFVLSKGHTPLTASQVDAFYSDAVSMWMAASGLPATAIALTSRNGGSDVMLIVDPANNFIWSGESQQFWNNANLSGNRGVFLDNLMYYIGNAAKYGSHFTDLFLEANYIDYSGKTRYAQPAPWDTDWWGANAGVPSK